MKCSKCGTENVKGKSVCKKCGAFLYSPNPQNRVALTPEQKKTMRKARVKGTALGCFWSALIIVGMFAVLGIISFLLVRFVIPEDYFANIPNPYTSETSGTAESTALPSDVTTTTTVSGG